jgi:alpha-L-rhamnosidase
MKKTRKVLATLMLAQMASLQAADVVNLECEYLKDPLGMDVARPRLSWVIDTTQSEHTRGVRQDAYQVLVASTPELLAMDKGDLWDTGKMESNQSIQLEYAGKPLESRMKSHWKVRLWTSPSASPTAWSAPASWTMGLLKPEDWQAKWITHPNPQRLSHPWLRRTVEIKEDIRRAVIHINTPSYYELHINGKKVGPHVLEPGITQNNKRFVVIAYDVTTYLMKGANTIALWMGPGWHQPRNGNTFEAPILRAELTVETPSGSMYVGTDASWRVSGF